MADLKVIENELVPVYETDKGVKVVNGRDLHRVLESKQDFSTWVKKRLSECDAVENEDFDRFHKKMEANNATMIDYTIKLDTAKEMAMLERNDKGKQVRKYFIQVEEKYKQTAININQLSPELQMFNQIFQQVAKTELEQKKLAERADQQEKNMKTIIDTFKGTDSDVGTEKWVNRCISKIAESDDFSYSFGNKYAAARNCFYNKGKSLECFVSYEPAMTLFNEWLKQLFAESEGKDGKGLFPVSCVFSTDLHSVGQYIQESGSKLMFETVMQFARPQSDYMIGAEEGNIDGLNFLAGKEMSYVNEKARQGTLLAHTAGGVGNFVLEIDALDAENMGYMIYFFEKVCAVSGYMLGVNPFNQPGVESYKKNMFALLGKPGYESEKENLEKQLGLC